MNIPVITPSPTPSPIASTSNCPSYSTPVSTISKRLSHASKLFDAKLEEFKVLDSKKTVGTLSPDSTDFSPSRVTPSTNRSTSEDLKFSTSYLHALESLLLRCNHPMPEIKESLYAIKRDLNSRTTPSPRKLENTLKRIIQINKGRESLNKVNKFR